MSTGAGMFTCLQRWGEGIGHVTVWWRRGMGRPFYRIMGLKGCIYVYIAL